MTKRTHRNPDHVQRHNRPSPDNEEVANQLEALLTPAIFAQLAYYRQLGMRERILNLPLMVAVVLTLLWRQVPGVQELNRLLAREDLLWCQATKVSQQALSQRFLAFPSELFERVFKEILPQLQLRWQERVKRPLPVSINYALKHFDRIWVADGSTLEALFCKLKSLEDVPRGQLAGKICTVIDMTTRLPVEVWFHTNPKANDTNFEADLLKLVTSKTLLLLDRGFYHFQFFATLISQQVDFITRIKAGAAIEVVQVNTHPNMMFEINSLNLVQAVILHQSSRCVELKFALVKLGIHTSLLSLTRLFYPLT